MDLRHMNHGFGPTPECRKKRTTAAAVTAVVLYFSVVVLHRTLKQGIELGKVVQLSDVVVWCGVISSAIFGELVRRVCLFAEEYHHADQRYMGSRRKALEACLWSTHNNQSSIIVFSVCSAILVYDWLSNDKTHFPLPTYLTSALLGSISTHLLDMKSPTKVEISELNESENKHVSDGLAWSYYFGYLKLILPKWEFMIDQAQGEKFNVNGDDIRDKIADKRLYIVIPKDGYCYDNFSEIDDRIDFHTTMPEQKRLRGGVQERIYRNSLYRITKGDEEKYVMMEYATPLLSMYDMSKETLAAFSEESREEQVVEFYKKLKEILDNDPECHDNFYLVLTARGNTGQQLKGQNNPKLADIIWDTINQSNVAV